MKARKKLLVLLASAFLLNLNAQEGGNQAQIVSAQAGLNVTNGEKGTFFISPYYELTRFKGLKLKELTGNITFPEGSSSLNTDQSDIDDYNSQYRSEYQSGNTGIRFGYQVLNGLGLSVNTGITHFGFKSFVNRENENARSFASDYPAMTFGATVDYHKVFYKKLTAVALLSYNYCQTGKTETHFNNSEKETILSSSLHSRYWQFNLAIAYPLGKFLPFAGAGFTQQFVKSKSTAGIDYTNNEGIVEYSVLELNPLYSGGAFYGFAGFEYRLNKGASVYIRSSFPDPLRANIGFRIAL